MKDNALRDAGLKATTPRVRILEIFTHHQQRHLSAEAIRTMLLDQGEDVGLATVYRVLTQFEAAGLVKRHNFISGRSVFELDEGKHHDHLVCIHCGYVAEFVNEEIEQQQIKIAKQHDFMMTDHNLTIYGICARCEQHKRGNDLAVPDDSLNDNA